MVPTREVVITGVGVVSPIGIGTDAFWTSLCEGRSGVAPLAWLRETELPVRFGAEVKDFDSKQHVKPRKSLKVMCREIQTGFSAAAMAVQDAGLAEGAVDPNRFGVVFGSEMFYCDIEELEDAYRSCMVEGRFDYDLWGVRALPRLYPLWMLKYLPNMAACHIAIAHAAHGPNNTISLGGASSLLALIEGVSVIQRGHADVVITGGTGSRLKLTPWLWRGHSNLSHRGDNPAAASRPFDLFRDGLVNGEGAAAFILESRAYAEARGAKAWARVLGSGMNFGAGSEPLRGAAIRHSITGALRAAGMDSGDIGHVNAHGASTIEQDKIEAQAIQDCLSETPLTAIKSFFGDLGAGGGAVEMVASVLSFAHGEVPRTLNYEHPDPNCPVNVIHGQPHRTRNHTALLLNQSATGQAAAVLLAGP